MDDKNFATQKVPVIGASTRKSTAESNKDYMAKSKKKKNEDGLGIFGGLVQSLGIGRK